MSGDTTSGRWVGRVLATGLTAAVGLGLTAGVAAADPTAAPAATQPVAAPTQLVMPDTAASVRRAWESRGRPHRMAVVRDHRIDVATEGRVTRQVGRAGGPLTLATLDRALPANWLTLDGDTATLDTTLVLTRGTSLRLGGNGSPRTLQLVGGAEPSDAASIHTGGGRIELTGVTVTSLDRETGQPLPATAKGRPSIVVSGGGRLDATDVTITDLGTVSEGTPGAEEDGAAAVEFRRGSTGSLVRTTVTRGSTGVSLSHAEGVRLEQLTVSDNTEDGLVLAGDRGTEMSGIRATGNGGNGVLASGETADRPVTSISTNANGAFGVAVVGETGTRVSDVDTTADDAGGLRISRSTDVTVTNYTATDQRMGVFTHVHSTGVVLDGVRTIGGGRGLVVEKSTRGLEARNSTFDGARVAGVAVGGADVALNAVHVSESRSAVRIERGAHDVRLAGLTVDGGRDRAGHRGRHVRRRRQRPDRQRRRVGRRAQLHPGRADHRRRDHRRRHRLGPRGGRNDHEHDDRRRPGGHPLPLPRAGLRVPGHGGHHGAGRQRRGGQPVHPGRLQRARAGVRARRDRAAGHQRPQPAPAQPPRRHRHPADRPRGRAGGAAHPATTAHRRHRPAPPPTAPGGGVVRSRIVRLIVAAAAGVVLLASSAWLIVIRAPSRASRKLRPSSWAVSTVPCAGSHDVTQLHFLGHGDVESYGLSWRTAGTGGAITDSLVSHLYYGLYTYQVSGLEVLDNEFRDNVLYGIDPHTGSSNLAIERNVVHDNGKHGIILAEDCVDSVIRDNVVYRNAHHGIVLYLGSDHNVVAGNATFANASQGINVNESAGNVLRGNEVYGNGETGVGVTQLAEGNVVEGNQVRDNRQDGVRVVSESAGTAVRDNVIAGNARYGVYVDTSGAVDLTGNTITGNRSGIMSTGAPVAPEDANDVRGNEESDVVADRG
jgi:parallel beta-helix repeat protein